MSGEIFANFANFTFFLKIKLAKTHQSLKNAKISIRNAKKGKNGQKSEKKTRKKLSFFNFAKIGLAIFSPLEVIRNLLNRAISELDSEIKSPGPKNSLHAYEHYS